MPLRFPPSVLRDTHLARVLGARVPGALLRGPTRDADGYRLLYVTLDDGPDLLGTPLLLRALDVCDARATAFLSADLAAARPDLARRWAEDGHRVGNHGGAHRSAWAMAPGAAVAEMTRAERVLGGIVGTAVRDVRPPYGRLTPGLVRWAREGGRRLVLWDVMPGDYDDATPAETIADRIVRLARPGSVVVLHDGRPAERAAHALRLALPRLAAAGWRFPALPALPLAGAPL